MRFIERLPVLLSLTLTVAPLAAQQAPRVLSVEPSLQNLDASPAATIVISFDRALDPGTVTLRSVRVFGRWSGVVPGTLELIGSGQVIVFRPLRPYFPSEHIRVEVSTEVASSGGTPLEQPLWSSFWVRPASGSGEFTTTEVIELQRNGEGSLGTYGVCAGDVNSDGSPDIIALNESTNDIRLLFNGGCAPFSTVEVIDDDGQRPSPAEGADFNGDGLFDLVTGNQGGNAISVFLGNGSGFNSPANYGTGGYTHGVAVLDVDGDGDTDVATPNSSLLLVYVNDGTGSLSLADTYDVGSGELGVSAADANGDGVADLIVSNFGSEDVAVMLGDGNGNFTVESTRRCGGSPFQSTVGDVNGDGVVDVVTANRGSNTLGVLIGNGDGTLKPRDLYPVGSNPDAVDLGDLDGDGDLDCVVSNFSSADYSVYWNDGSGVFGNRQTIEAPAGSSCTTIVDFNRDGLADLILSDEIVDELQLCPQVSSGLPGVQPTACTATLRINNMGNRAGFGGRPPTPVQLGERAFFGVSGESNRPYALALGIRSEPGFAIPAGLINLNLALQPIFLIDGFTGSGGPGNGMTNSVGESLNWAVVPMNMPLGIRATLQALIVDSTAINGLRLTNPEVVEFTL